MIYNTCKPLIIKPKSKTKVSIHQMLDILGYQYVDIYSYLDCFVRITHNTILDAHNSNFQYVEDVHDFDFGIKVDSKKYDNMINEIIKLCHTSNKHIYDLSFNEIKTNIKKTDLYMEYEKLVFDRMNRSIILSKYLNDTNINNFYDNLTLEEMKKINKYFI